MKKWINIIALCIVFSGCASEEDQNTRDSAGVILTGGTSTESPAFGQYGLLLSRFNAFDEFKKVVDIEYFRNGAGKAERVEITHRSGERMVKSTLEYGVTEADFLKARDGTFRDRVALAVKCPYALFHRKDLLRTEILARRRYQMFGEGDMAFYDIAELTVCNIVEEDLLHLSPRDLSEKGFLNTFNHITAQALITSLFSAEIAQFVSDIHERRKMPELITGEFSVTQIQDLDEGALDNYLDIINNKWGQQLGEQLKKKYTIDRQTLWTPQLMADYLNDTQAYYSQAFGVGFHPFRETDDIAIRFSDKINRVMADVEQLKNYYY